MEKNIDSPKNDRPRILPGAIKINDRYEVQNKIATGGMADVYLGKDLDLKRMVAIKILHESYASNKNFIARFKREAQNLAGLTHPNIVEVYDWGEFRDLYFIVMEYVRGENLKTIIDKSGAFDPVLAAQYAIQICDALSVAHSINLIHRDIKPQNIMVTPEGVVKVTDFGIAKFIADDNTKTLNIIGTASYISPEQVQGKVLDDSSDIYSLGIVMYEMLSADVPFRGGSPIDISLRHITEKPQPPSSSLIKIPEGFEKIIMKCIEKDPLNRYRSVKELKNDLQNFLHNRPLNSDLDIKKKEERKKRFFPDLLIQNDKNLRRTDIRFKRFVISLLIFSFLMLSLFSVFLTLFLIDKNRYVNIINRPVLVTVPPVEGLSISQADALFSTYGLNMVVTESVYSDDIPLDYVLSQEPGGAAEIKPGSDVLITVSKGKKIILIDIPNLVGLKESEAIEILENSGLKQGEISEKYSDIFSPGTVLSQQPGFNVQVQPGTPVGLEICKKPEKISVPNLIGYDYFYVFSNLESLGLKVATSRKTDTTVPAGTVVEIVPVPGTELDKDDVVKIYISTNEQLTEVPFMVNKNIQEAASLLESLGLKYEVSYIDVSYSIQKDSVLSHLPEAGEQVSPNDFIILFVGR